MIDRQKALEHLNKHLEQFQEVFGRTPEEYFSEYWYKYEDGAIYLYVCADLGIEPEQ